MSRAVVTWPGSGRPEALRKTVDRIPSERAVRVMRSANAASVPAMFSATTAATSLADLTQSAPTASATVRVDPALAPSFDGGWAAAAGETVKAEFIARRPLSTSLNRM
jgi:hypothetical protein